MGVGMLIISHEGVGEALLKAVSAVLGHCPLDAHCMAIPMGCQPEDMFNDAKKMLQQLDSGEGVLVMTDIYGSTPANIACGLMEKTGVVVVSGVNIPMLMRVLNYPSLSLEELAEKAVSGGKEGIMDCRLHQH